MNQRKIVKLIKCKHENEYRKKIECRNENEYRNMNVTRNINKCSFDGSEGMNENS